VLILEVLGSLNQPIVFVARPMAIRILLTCVLLLIRADPSTRADDDDMRGESLDAVVLTFNPEGLLELSTIGVMSWEGPLAYLRCPSVADELELVGSQRQEVELVVTDWRREYEQHLQLRTDSHLNEEEWQVGLESIHRKFLARLSEHLLPHQIDRLKQIRFRHTLRTQGSLVFE
jgi:hypothetical protein